MGATKVTGWPEVWTSVVHGDETQPRKRPAVALQRISSTNRPEVLIAALAAEIASWASLSMGDGLAGEMVSPVTARH